MLSQSPDIDVESVHPMKDALHDIIRRHMSDAVDDVLA